MSVNGELILEEKLQTLTRGQIVWLVLTLVPAVALTAVVAPELDDVNPFLLFFSFGGGISVVILFISWIKTFSHIQVFSDRVEVVSRFLVTSRRRIEASKVESVDFSQSLLGRSLYGSLTIRGSGTGTLQLLPLRNPEKVAEAVRSIAAKAQTKSEPVSPKLDSATGSLAELISMKAQGHLTEEEFSAAKKKLLG